MISSGTSAPAAVFEACRLHADNERLEALAEFAAGAGHEINNPVATISGRVQLLLRGETDPARRQALETIAGQAHRIRDMIGDLMLFARPPAPKPERVDLIEALHRIVEPLKEKAAERGCSLELLGEDDVAVWADRTQLAVVVSCLVNNSLNVSPPGKPITVTARCPAGARDAAVLAVEDFGPGLSETDRRHLFDPFYSGRQAGRGLGFGLPKCWRIVSNHRGRIEVESTPGGQTVLTVFWPSRPWLESPDRPVTES